MKTFGEKNFFSPTMFVNYINYNRFITDEFNEKIFNLKKSEKTIVENLRIKKGLTHEEEYFKILKKKYKKVKNIKILKNLSKKEKIQETINSLKNGYELIYGGWLASENWIGEFDFLEINNHVKSDLGSWSYEVIDTKNSPKVKKEHIYQVSLYSLLLKETQGILPKNFYILLKDNKKEAIKLKDVFNTFLVHKENFEKFIKNDFNRKKLEKISSISQRDLQKFYENEWKVKKDLNLLLGCNKNSVKKINQAGIYSFDKLAKFNPKKEIKGLRDETKIKLINQAKLQMEAEKEGTIKFKYIEKNFTLNKGFNLLPEPTQNDLFFDLEGVQDYVYEGKLEYLFGIFYEEKGEKIFKPFWAHNRQEEKKSLIKFFEFTKKHFEKYPKSKIYHYAPYEINALERLTSFHKVHGIDYDHWLNLNKFVDLLKVVKQGIYVSQKSYSIKDIEKYYDFKRTGDILKGDISEEFYIEWMENNDQQLLDKIEEYNKQDCQSTFRLREWLLKIKPKQTRWFVPEKDHLEIRPFEETLLEYQEKFKDSKINNKVTHLLSDIIGFFNREQKPQWRQHFDRKDLSDSELIEDRECIAQMKLASVFQDKKSYVYKYYFPEQEYKLKEGRKCIIANNTDLERSDYAGKIQELDQLDRSLLLRKGISKEEKKLPKVLSIGEEVMGHSFFENLNKNTYTFCDNVLNEKDGYEAIKSFINRDTPKIRGVEKGEKIIKNDNFDIEIPKIILNLQNSYIFLQGPPGSGKTYQASNAIIELLKKNKKIAVTANSHKVIHTLLERVENLAIKKKYTFKGLKKGNPDDPDTFYDGKFIKTDRNEKHYIDGLKDNKILLFAGTKYHLSHWYYQNKLDYLFVDEASQISVADLIALGGIAKNIILIGDQMQLGQPTQGTHPGESGYSVLDYLLEGKDTIPDDKGIFLNKTYRLHPKINSFISENFYEDRLLVNQANINRKIEFKKNSIIKFEGIHTILMNHEGRSQQSIEEFEIIKKIVDQLIGCEFTDFDQSKRKIDVDDILIVSPYNVQVNFLKERLIKDIRCGTIDKFQGMEAPIVIISMTSSSVEDLPRNKKFFFNRNRLNVAISRAQCSSIILLNPRLLESSPSDYEEFKLINNFHKLLKFQIN